MPWMWLRPRPRVDIVSALENNPGEGSRPVVVSQGVRRNVAGSLVVACLAACSFVVDSDRVQCSNDSECQARGAQFIGSVCSKDEKVCMPEPAWRCLDQPPEPPPTSGKFKAPFHVQHVITQMPLSGIRARVCRRLDVLCSTPLGEERVTDAQGNVTLDVDASFEGYVYFEGTDVRGLYFFNPPVVRDLSEISLSIGNREVIGLLAAQAGAVQAPGRGVILLSAHDCTGAPAAGITIAAVDAPPDTVPFYSEQSLPSGSAKQTDDTGYGGLLNVEPASVTFTATIAKTQRRLGQITVLARDGAITYGRIVPYGP
jgi:hypothetical protein